MEELIFNSTLSEEEIAKNFENIDFFSGITSGLEASMAGEEKTLILSEDSPKAKKSC